MPVNVFTVQLCIFINILNRCLLVCNMNFSIIDSTLREGEQFINGNFSIDQKINIIKLLNDFSMSNSSRLSGQKIQNILFIGVCFISSLRYE